MDFRCSLIFLFSVIIIVIPYTYGNKIKEQTDPLLAFDSDLYESVLDPELCAKQLQYLRNDTLLSFQFLESGLRLPRGILKGNLMDYGNYPQCLSINKELEDMTIKGKYCMVNLPLSVNLQTQNDYKEYKEFDTTELHFEEEYLELLEQIKKEKSLVLAREGINTNRNYLTRDDDSNMKFLVAVCLPQSCTTREALNSFFFNLSAIGFEYEDVYCRLPDDKPWVAADYIAWVMFGLLGVITILSTSYDVFITIILKKDPKKASELLSAFSAYKNSCRLIKITSRPGSLECLDGIRALSIMWVIIGHTFMMATYYPANPIDMFGWYISLRAIWMKTAPLAVDTFFLLSGLLVVYTTAKKFSARQLARNLHVFYLHRLLRIFPVLAAVILFKTSFYHHIGDGPVWVQPAADVQTCRTYWWLTLLHLQNFLRPNNTCVGEAWYLAIDMQLHILSPLVLIWVLSGKKTSAWVALILGFLISLTAATIYIFTNDIPPEGLDNFVYYYVNILTRAPPFFIGMIYGYLLHLWRDDKCEMRKRVGYLTTAISLCILALILYSDHIHVHGDITQAIDNVFMAYKRTSWAIIIGWIIFACVNGYAGPINWFLSLSVWKIPSRISYAMYLIHLTFMLAYYGSALQPVYFTVPLFIFDFCAFLYITMFIAFFVTVLVDAPFATLFGLLLTGGRKKPRSDVLTKNKEINAESTTEKL